jgi:hypothetical protein
VNIKEDAKFHYDEIKVKKYVHQIACFLMCIEQEHKNIAIVAIFLHLNDWFLLQLVFS